MSLTKSVQVTYPVTVRSVGHGTGPPLAAPAAAAAVVDDDADEVVLVVDDDDDDTGAPVRTGRARTTGDDVGGREDGARVKGANVVTSCGLTGSLLALS
jgi:hypothetical protein